MNTQKGSMGIEIICQQAPKPKNSGKLVYKQLDLILLKDFLTSILIILWILNLKLILCIIQK